MSIQHGIALTGTITLLASIIMVAEPAAAVPTKTEMVAMRDGTRLVTDIYLPGNNENGKYPVVVIRTPYPREGGQDMTNAGYAVVFQSTRGRFGSEGKDLIFFDDGWGANQDGYDAIEWVAKQPWCNGQVGTFGGSAPAIMQYRLAGSGSPNIDTQAVIFGGSNLYHHLFFQGGAFRKEIMDPWLESCKFTPDVLTMIHEHPGYDDYWRNYDLSTRYGKVNMPMIHMAGWYDILLQGNIDAFVGTQYHGGEGAKGKQKLVIGPSSHGAFDKIGEIEFPDTAKHNPFTEVIGWFEYQLQGKDNAMSKQSVVTYYTMGATGEKDAPGNEWKSSDVWPIPSKAAKYYLHKDGTLGTGKPRSKNESKSYKYNPDNPVPTVGGQNLIIEAGPYDQRKVEGRSDVLLFTTKPLTEPVEVTGRVKVKLWASSSAKDTDFTAKLTDVYPDGRSMLVCDGIIRARYRNSFEKPELMEPGKVYEIEVDLWSTSMIFNKGHRIRLVISSSNSPRFDANPNTGEPVFDAKRKEIAENTVYFDASRPSAVILPVVKPAK
ncbi:MAG: CocE/NonD family hydrolase [Armatimonadota bacterium]